MKILMLPSLYLPLLGGIVTSVRSLSRRGHDVIICTVRQRDLPAVAKLLSCLDQGIDEEAVRQSQNFSWRKTAAETIKVYERVYNA